MKIYQSYKKVSAARITGYGILPSDPLFPESRALELTLDDGSQVHVVGPRFDAVEIGGYFVRYEDGYTSYSPAEAFENGYMELGPAPDPLDEPKAAPAPRVTLADIHDAIESEHYFTAAQGDQQAQEDQHEGRSVQLKATSARLGLLTFCVLVLKNGFTVTGESACVSAENFDANTGRQLAHENAINKCWQLFGFALADRIHRGNPL